MNQLTAAFLKPKVLVFYLFIFSAAHGIAQSGPKAIKRTGYSAASYRGINAGKVMRSWLVTGPIKNNVDTSAIPDANSQQKFFDREDGKFISAAAGNTMPQVPSIKQPTKWIPYTSKKDIIDFDSLFRKADYASAYALAEIYTEVPVTALLGIGSDDGLKIWLNGKLVHKNWVARALKADDDVVKIDLIKGSNHLLIEVQDIEQGWGFTARFLDKDGLSNRLAASAAGGDLDMIRQLIDAGADINKRNESGQTAMDAARIQGREEVVHLLAEKSAAKLPVPSPEILIDGKYNSILNKPHPAVNILVAKDGKILYKKGFGYADVENKIKVVPETKFRIGSITKQFVAAAILKLQEEGRLKVTDKLTTYFPDFQRGDEVTIHHLLTHTSGIVSFTNKDSFLIDVVKPVTNEQLLNYFKNDKYDFNPGERYQYNNSGYFLLGYIVEKLTGESFGNYLKKKFFDPIGMNSTGVYSTGLNLEHEAIGYQNSDSGFHRALNWDMSWAAGAGALYSTLEDLYKWNEAVFNGKVLSAESMKAAFTPVVLNNGSKPPGTEYGYGWGLDEYRGMATIGHSGGLHGFISQLIRVPKENLTVVMFTNAFPPDIEMNPTKIAEAYLWEKMARQSSFALQNVSEKDLEKYTGRYDFTNSMVMLITKEGENLFAQMSGQSKFPIFPSAPAQFYWKVVDAKIHFIQNAEGNVDKAHFEQGGFKIDALKLQDIHVVTPDSAILVTYKGNYEFKKNFLIAITTAGEKIFAQATGEPRFEMLPLSDIEFLIKELNARLVFTKDASGKVNNLNIDMAGQKKDAPKVE